MLQFYFLSIMLNLLTGFILIFSRDKGDASGGDSTKSASSSASKELVDIDDDIEENGEETPDNSETNSADEKLDELAGDIGEIFSDEKPSTSDKPTFLDAILCDNRFVLVVSFVSIFTGFVKLVSPISGIPVFGDFLPFVAAFAAGFSLLLGYLMDNTSIIFPPIVENIFIGGKKFIGFFCVAVALLHFICPNVILF